jgi:hypothetical protein
LAPVLKYHYYYYYKKGEWNGWIIWRARVDCTLLWNTWRGQIIGDQDIDGWYKFKIKVSTWTKIRVIPRRLACVLVFISYLNNISQHHRLLLKIKLWLRKMYMSSWKEKKKNNTMMFFIS